METYAEPAIQLDPRTIQEEVQSIVVVVALLMKKGLIYLIISERLTEQATKVVALAKVEVEAIPLLVILNTFKLADANPLAVANV